MADKKHNKNWRRFESVVTMPETFVPVTEVADLAIIIVSYNTADHLKRCLLSLAKNPYSEGTFSVVVVDNNSTDESVKMVRKVFPWVHLIENKTNKGFAAGCNQGIMAINAKYYLLLNSDAAVMGNALNVIAGFMEANPDIGIAGGLILTEDGGIQPSTLIFPNYWNLLFSRSSILSRVPPFKWYMEQIRRVPNEVVDVPAVAGGFMIIRSESLQQVGLLDERFFIYLEDIDICRRMWKAGWRVTFNPNARVLHTWGASSKQRKTKAFWWHHLSMFKYFQKYFPYLLPINLLLLAGLVLHFICWRFLQLIPHFTSVKENVDLR